MTQVNTIMGVFTVQRYQDLKKRYNEALKAGYHGFIFEGEHVLTEFAKQLLEFLEPQLGHVK